MASRTAADFALILHFAGELTSFTEKTVSGYNPNGWLPGQQNVVLATY